MLTGTTPQYAIRGSQLDQSEEPEVGLFGRKLEGSHSLFCCYFLTSIRQNELLMLK